VSTQDRGHVQRPVQDEDAEVEVVATSGTDAELDADVDAILDEIDEVLEVNAEDFVKSFVQKGGQ
jgi:prokaryotic ubiquitin-like protein Pup